MPNDLIENNFFGYAVALDGDTLIAGAPTYFSANNEAAYVFTRAGTTWTQQQKLTAPGGAADREFGRAVAIAGDVALVGAPNDHDDTQTPGVVYVFTRAGATWSPAGSFAPDDSAGGDNFGCAIDFDGQTAVVGACKAYGMPSGPGLAYVFVRQGNNFVQQAKLIADVNGLPLEVDDVALQGDRVVLGASDAAKVAGVWTGAAFVYERQGTSWTNAQTLYAEDGQDQDGFGGAVALSADALLVGARDKNVLNNEDQGAVYAFTPISGEVTPRVYLPVAVRPAPPAAPDDLIVYIDKVGSENDIFTIDPNGAGKTNLTQTPTQGEYGPRWSPDRQQIAFTRIEPSSVANLWVMNGNGSGQKVIPTPNLDMMGGPDWSPDGQKIAFSAYTKYIEWDIYVVNVDGSGLTNLTADLAGEASEPSWSPDGTRIVFRHYPDEMDLVVMNADGSNKTNLTNNAFFENYPHWSPDGQSILFFGGPGGGGGPSLYVMPAAGGQPQQLIQNAIYGRWSADMSQVVFSSPSGGVFRAGVVDRNVIPVDESPDAALPDW
jgi:Tol biopolymer transport system component